jgi:hypothetical protein
MMGLLMNNLFEMDVEESGCDKIPSFAWSD